MIFMFCVCKNKIRELIIFVFRKVNFFLKDTLFSCKKHRLVSWRLHFQELDLGFNDGNMVVAESLGRDDYCLQLRTLVEHITAEGVSCTVGREKEAFPVALYPVTLHTRWSQVLGFHSRCPFHITVVQVYYRRRYVIRGIASQVTVCIPVTARMSHFAIRREVWRCTSPV